MLDHIVGRSDKYVVAAKFFADRFDLSESIRFGELGVSSFPTLVTRLRGAIVAATSYSRFGLFPFFRLRHFGKKKGRGR
jgi:hypothetical protein